MKVELGGGEIIGKNCLKRKHIKRKSKLWGEEEIRQWAKKLKFFISENKLIVELGGKEIIRK